MICNNIINQKNEQNIKNKKLNIKQNYKCDIDELKAE